LFSYHKTSQKEDYVNGEIIEINEEKVKVHLGDFVRETASRKLLRAMPEAEAEQLCQAQRQQRSAERQGY